MTKIEIHGTTQCVEIPESWDEMTPEQIRFVFKTHEECVRKGRSPLDFNITVLYYLMGVKRTFQSIRRFCTQKVFAEKVSENVYWLCHNCLSFLFEQEKESDQAPRLAYRSVINSLPEVRSKVGPLLIGPADLLSDLTFGEFRKASAALSAFFKSREMSDLDECIACLYRRRSKTANRAGRKVRPIGFDFEKDIRLAGAIPVWQKNLIMCWFSSCLEYLQTGKITLDSEEVNLQELFRGSDEPGPKFNWTDLLIQLARENTIGNIDRVDKEPLFSIISVMWTNHKEHKRYESIRKTSQGK